MGCAQNPWSAACCGMPSTQQAVPLPLAQGCGAELPGRRAERGGGKAEHGWELRPCCCVMHLTGATHAQGVVLAFEICHMRLPCAARRATGLVPSQQAHCAGKGALYRLLMPPLLRGFLPLSILPPVCRCAGKDTSYRLLMHPLVRGFLPLSTAACLLPAAAQARTHRTACSCTPLAAPWCAA